MNVYISKQLQVAAKQCIIYIGEFFTTLKTGSIYGSENGKERTEGACI